MSPRPERPADEEYYERERVELFSQGDLFRDVPLAYPMPAEELVIDEDEGGGSRRFLSGPLAFGPAMLITPSCSFAAQGSAGYAHPVRTLVPVIPLAHLLEGGILKETALADLRRFDHLINYMYLPPLDVDELEFSMPESVALLYMPVTLHQAFLEGQRLSQLAYRGAQIGAHLPWTTESVPRALHRTSRYWATWAESSTTGQTTRTICLPSWTSTA